MLTHSAILALAAVATAAPPDTSEPERLAILPVLLGESSPLNDRDVFKAVDRAVELRSGLRAMSIDDYFFREGRALTKRTLACGLDTRCMAKQLAPFQANLGLIVLLNAELSPPLASLFLIDERTEDHVEQWAGQLEGDREALLARLEQEVSKLLDARGLSRSGRLSVDVEPAQAKLTVGDATSPDPGTSNLFTLLPGRYLVRGTSEGFEPASTSVTIEPGVLTETSLRLEEASSVWTSPWLWAAVGVVVVGAATATTLALTHDDPARLCLAAIATDCEAP